MTPKIVPPGDPTGKTSAISARSEIDTALHHLTDARAAIERALHLDDDGFVRDALRLAVGDVDSVARRVRNAGEFVRRGA